MDRIGHGQPTEMSSQEALAIAKAATPQTEERADANDPFGRKAGMRVQVAPDDIGRDPVVGELLSLSTVRSGDPAHGSAGRRSGGALPRAGFVIQPAQ